MPAENYSLQALQELAREELLRMSSGQRGIAVFRRPSTIEPIQSRLDHIKGAREAIKFALETVLLATHWDFSETLGGQGFPFPADVYGIRREGCVWYTKVAIDKNGVLHVVSCHPAGYDMHTRAGNIGR